MKNMLAFMEDRRLRFLLVPWVMELAAEVYPEVDAAVEHFCDKHPDLKHRYGQEYIGRILLRVLRSEEPAKSLEYQSLFHTLNTMYFGGRLPEYWIRAVY